jgi:dethiobiotin synthetase
LPTHDPRSTTHGFFVTGTDTGVGKTLAACALLRALVAAGYSAIGMKPVASGAARRGNDLIHSDVEQLIAAGNVTAPRSHVNPYCFEPPIAPHIAAERAGVSITLDRIEDSFRDLAARAQVVIVEGVGGFRVPLGASGDTAQLAERLALPVVLVVALRLGCLNHALLTADAIAASRLQLAGWIANEVDPGMSARDENVSALEERIAAPLIARVGHSASPQPGRIAAALDIRRLLS